MLKPYSTVDETPTEITYEFKTIYLWLLYGILVAGAIGLLLKEPIVSMIAGGCLLLYFLTVSLQYRRLGAITHNAAMSGEVRYSGSKWSFANPLRITIPNTKADAGAAPEP